MTCTLGVVSVQGVWWCEGGNTRRGDLVRCILCVVSVEAVRWGEGETVIGEAYIGCSECTGG